ncbi:MAG: DUF427 domain-containing protein [Solirubrobacteraceae bacterium]
MKAVWKGQTIAESDATVVVEGNHPFPAEAVNQEMLVASAKTTHCPWKGEASYVSITVAGDVNHDAAWFYPAPKEAAAQIEGRYAFWKGVSVVSS